MPNVRGLQPADALYASLKPGASTPYGPHCTVQITADGATLALIENARSLTIAQVTFTGAKPRIKARVAEITEDTATPVNALLKPYGRVKVNWRSGQREWKPASGTPAATPARVVTPKPAPSTAEPKAEQVVITVSGEYDKRGTGVRIEEVVPEPETAEALTVVAAPAIPHPSTAVLIETEREYTGPASRRPVIKPLTKTWSQVGEVLMPASDVATLDIAWSLRAAGDPAAVLITGPAGTAKTRLAEQFAFAKGVPFIKVDGASIQTADDWYGGFVPTAGGFEWRWTDMARALMRGTPCVILVDEINRPENERALNGLMGLADWTGTVKPNGAPFALHLPPGILLMATLNEGPEYVGTVQVDGAVRDRFGWGIRMDYSAENIEARILRAQAPGIDPEIAKRLVRVAAGQRAKREDGALYPSGATISTRNLIAIARAITVSGVDAKTAIWANLRSRFWVEDEPALTVLIEAQFGADVPTTTDPLPDDEDLERFLDAGL